MALWGGCATPAHMRSLQSTPLRRIALVFAAALALAASASLSGCATKMMTPAQISANGARPYAAHDAKALVRATSTALETMGFEVVVSDAATGKIVTAPRTVVIKEHAPIAVTWSIDVVQTPSGAIVHAQPRYLKSGAPIASLDAPYVEASLTELFAEINASLPSATETTSAR